MQLRLPWILSRKRLVAAVIADGCLFSFLYYRLFEFRFGSWPVLSSRIAALLIIWTLGSYVIGRYSDWIKIRPHPGIWNFVAKHLIATFLVLCISLGTAFFYTWFLSQDPVQNSFGSLLIPFLGILSITSPFIQLALRLLVLRDPVRSTLWSYIGPASGFRQLQEMLKWSRIQVQVEHVMPNQLQS